jgi:hypothetical protein
MGKTFIYKPRSGDRVFISLEGDEIGVLEYPNGCRHAVGGVHLRLSTAEPDAYWRGAAIEAAKTAVSGIGQGVSWDDRGTIHMVVPVWAAYQVTKGMLKVAEATGIPFDKPGGLEGAASALAGAALLANNFVGKVHWNASLGEFEAITDGYGRVAGGKCLLATNWREE